MTQNPDTCILLFVKFPEKGKVKRRLSANLREDVVQDLYRCFVEDTLILLKNVDACLFICFFPADAKKKFQKWLGSTLAFLPQNGKDLGERMNNCFTEAFAKGFQRVVLIGSDSPDLPEEYILQAFTMLQTHDAVLGPSVDGGYYLIGFRKTTCTSQVFEDIPWSSHTVLQQTLMKIKQMHYSIGLLPVWSDVDTITDLKNLSHRAQNTSFKSSQTMTYIHKHHIRLEKDNGTKSKT